jgi:DNA-binding response OmpR family regulator
MDNPSSPLGKVFRHGNLEIDTYAARVTKGTKEVTLTAREYSILLLFARNMGKVIPMTEMINLFWGSETSCDKHLIYLSVSRLRKKIEDEPENPIHIRTVRGIGYMMPNMPLA